MIMVIKTFSIIRKKQCVSQKNGQGNATDRWAY